MATTLLANQNKIQQQEIDLEMTELDIYKTILENAAKKNLSEIFTNADELHAAIAFSILFKNSSSKLFLIANSFDGKISNNPIYVDALKEFLAKENIEVKILTLEPPQNSAGYLAIQESMNDGKNIQVKQATPQSIEILKTLAANSVLDFGEVFNFSVFDGKRFRLEYQPSSYKALLSFNDTVRSGKYASVFLDAFNVAA